MLRDLFHDQLKSSDKGVEVGSDKYITKSSHYFLRSKSLQENSFLPELVNDSYVPLNPKAFINYKLSEGDILISKDSNIGEVVILDKDYPNYMPSGALYRLPLAENKYYVLAFLKSRIFRDQLDLKVSKGATIRHAGTKFLECKIPFPNQENSSQVIGYVELLTKSIINKEKEIKHKNELIFKQIEDELLGNQSEEVFSYQLPVYNKISEIQRLDVGLYCEDFQRNNFIVKNYKNGHINLIARGYKWARGTSLEIKGIGTRLNSKTYKEGFYELVIPTNISEYGTITESGFIGTPKKLKTIKMGDIIFGGEGFQKGRCFVVCENVDNIATNYHGIRIYRETVDLIDSIFVRCFLAFWRSKGMVDYIGVGGSGGHCAPQYFDFIETPIFPEDKKQQIAKLYYNSKTYIRELDSNNFESYENAWNNEAGIYELDQFMKKIKNRLNKVLNDISNDKEVLIDFAFLSSTTPL